MRQETFQETISGYHSGFHNSNVQLLDSIMLVFILCQCALSIKISRKNLAHQVVSSFEVMVWTVTPTTPWNIRIISCSFQSQLSKIYSKTDLGLSFTIL